MKTVKVYGPGCQALRGDQTIGLRGRRPACIDVDGGKVTDGPIHRHGGRVCHAAVFRSRRKVVHAGAAGCRGKLEVWLRA